MAVHHVIRISFLVLLLLGCYHGQLFDTPCDFSLLVRCASTLLMDTSAALECSYQCPVLEAAAKCISEHSACKQSLPGLIDSLASSPDGSCIETLTRRCPFAVLSLFGAPSTTPSTTVTPMTSSITTLIESTPAVTTQTTTSTQKTNTKPKKKKDKKKKSNKKKDKKKGKKPKPQPKKKNKKKKQKNKKGKKNKTPTPKAKDTGQGKKKKGNEKKAKHLG